MMAHNVAFVEDGIDDEGSSLEGVQGTRVYAISEAPMTPTKERPNTSKSRGGDRPSGRRGNSSCSSGSTSRSSKSRDDSYEREESRRMKELARQRREEDRKNRDRYSRESEVRRAQDEQAAAMQMPPPKRMGKPRPGPPKHAMSQPVIEQGGYRRGHVDDPRYFGVQQPAVSGPRPRNTRPASYYAGQPPRPPMSGMNWQQPPPGPFPVGTFPPPMVPGGPPPGMPGHGPPPMSPMGPPPDFYDGPPPVQSSRALRDRFERPSSAMGFGASPSQRSYIQEEYGYDDEPRHSTSRPPRSRKQQDDDRKAMPPPPPHPHAQYKSVTRSKTTAPSRTPFVAPPSRPISRQGKPSRPPPSHRRSIGYGTSPGGYDDDDFHGDDHLFHDVSPEAKYDTRRQALTRARRDSVMYDEEDYDIIPARTRHRRTSTYGHNEIGSGGVSLDESKYLGALQYQEDIGGSPMPLTAEVLKRANSRRDIASSRSTRSTASRDESDYKRSNTTGLTSTSGHDDNRVTITGTTKVYLADGTEIECHDGSITLSGGGVRLGSDTGPVYQIEDGSRGRMKALPHRPRAPSQSDATSRYAPSRVPYSYHDDYPNHEGSFEFDDDDDDYYD